MRAGKLNQRVQIQQLTETQNTEGGIVRTWTTVDTRWAEVEPLSGKELVEAQQINKQISYKVRLRHYPGLDENYRLRLAVDG